MWECDPISSRGLHKILPDMDGDFLRTCLRSKSVFGEDGKPRVPAIGHPVSDHRANLLPPLLKQGSNEVPICGWKDDGPGFSHEVQQAGINLRTGMEAGGGHRMSGSHIEGGLKENGNRPK